MKFYLRSEVCKNMNSSIFKHKMSGFMLFVIHVHNGK